MEQPPPVVAVENLSKIYGDSVCALDDVSFKIWPGEVVGVLGPNGAGKTTCLKCILGLIKPTDGQVAVGGYDACENPRAVHRHVGTMLEGARNVYWRLTARENLEFFAGVAGRDPADLRDRHDELLERLNIAERSDEKVKNLSRGMKQKVSLATTLARDVDVAFLDEPTLGLDIESSIELREELETLVEEENLAVVISSHDMDVIQDLCDRVIVLSEGELIANDSVESLLDVFRTQSYRVRIEDPPEEPIRPVVDEICNVTSWERQERRLSMTVTVGGETQLAELVSTLCDLDGTVDQIDSVEPDLEEVFLEITESDGV